MSEMKICKLWWIFMLVLSVIKFCDCACKFNGLVATCDMIVGGLPLVVSARINHCHAPIDITFQVHGESSGPWRYTYVTTNQPESRSITDRVTLAMMCETPSVKNSIIKVHAQFLVDGADGDQLTFLDQEIRLPDSRSNCVLPPTGDGSSDIAYYIVALAGAGLGAVLVGLAVMRARRGGMQDQDRLVNNMEKCTVDSTVVQYVVPGPETADIRLYVSTSDGLRPVGSPTKPKNNKISANPKDAETEFGSSGPPSDEIGLVNNAFDMEEGDSENTQDVMIVKKVTKENDGKSSHSKSNKESKNVKVPDRTSNHSMEGPVVDRSKKRGKDQSKTGSKDRSKIGSKDQSKTGSKDRSKKSSQKLDTSTIVTETMSKSTGAIPKKSRLRNNSSNSSGSRGSSGSSSASVPIR